MLTFLNYVPFELKTSPLPGGEGEAGGNPFLYQPDTHQFTAVPKKRKMLKTFNEMKVKFHNEVFASLRCQKGCFGAGGGSNGSGGWGLGPGVWLRAVTSLSLINSSNVINTQPRPRPKMVALRPPFCAEASF